MKTNKSYKEAILRAYSTEKDVEQDQEHLLALKNQVNKSGKANAEGSLNEDPIIESPKNIMRSWLNLRGLDQNIDAERDKKSKRKS